MLLALLLEQCEAGSPVVVDEEDVLGVGSTLGDVVRHARHHDSCESCHGHEISRSGAVCQEAVRK